LVEPQGLALLEAFAAEVPVVASRTDGIVEMIDHGVEGLLVEPGDPDALAAAMSCLLEDDKLRAACIRNARRRVTQFDVRDIARQYEALYDTLLARGRHKRNGVQR
jgi:glycosyltransferase involved in cell wall biosynthesis